VNATAAGELQRLEAIIDTAGIAAEIEALLPIGVRPRQLRVRTLLVGMVLTMLDGRGALLKGVHRTLIALAAEDQQRLAVITQWPEGPHALSYRQLEYTWRLIVKKLSKDQPDGSPSEQLSHMLDRLLEASVQVLGQPSSTSYAVDWTDLETWARPPRKPRPNQDDTDTDTGTGDTDGGDTDITTTDSDDSDDGVRRCADPEAAWGHRNSNNPARNEIFHGYYLQAITSVKDEHGPQVPELARRMQIASCDHDPPAMLVPVIERMVSDGITVGDLLADSGYAYRIPATWALPLRTLGIDLVQDLHPNDRGPNGTHQGASCCNGNLYCPATPPALLELSPLHPGATQEQTILHDQQCAELARYKLSAINAYDHDGYRRVACPATTGKIRCPLRPGSLTLPHNRPTVLAAPEHPPACCQQQTITVPPSVNTKTAQKHDYPSPAHRASYKRRTAAERTFATITDRATNDLSRGWCRLTGLAPIALFTATAITARNIRTADAYTARQAENQRRATSGLPPKQRKRRRHTLQNLAAAANPPPPQPAAPAN
jgi:hypothetical protein